VVTEPRTEAGRRLAAYRNGAYVNVEDILAIEAEAAAGPRDEGLTWETLATVVSDSLAATTEGTDWAEAPEPSDEPGSPYVKRLTNEMWMRLGQHVGSLAKASE